MKIYTKKGDEGKTVLVDGTPVEKSHIRLESYGTLDELNSHLGLLLGFMEKDQSLGSLIKGIHQVQNWLFQLGSQLACSNEEMAQKLPTIGDKEIAILEDQIDQWDEELPPLKNFVLPGGHLASSQAHICRTISRRAERLCVKLNSENELEIPVIPFLNRLSDYFFVLARLINKRTGIPTHEWKA